MKILTYIILLFPLSSWAEVKFYSLDSSRSSMIVKGDSTLHEWEMEAHEIGANSTVTFSPNKKLRLKDFELMVPTKKLKSDKSSLNKKAHAALKADKYEQIRFDYDETQEFDQVDNKASFIVKGTLSIAGTSRPIEISGNMDIQDNEARIIGQHRLKMSHFDVDPPGMLFIKSKDEIDIHFDLVLTQEAQ